MIKCIQIKLIHYKRARIGQSKTKPGHPEHTNIGCTTEQVYCLGKEVKIKEASVCRSYMTKYHINLLNFLFHENASSFAEKWTCL